MSYNFFLFSFIWNCETGSNFFYKMTTRGCHQFFRNGLYHEEVKMKKIIMASLHWAMPLPEWFPGETILLSKRKPRRYFWAFEENVLLFRSTPLAGELGGRTDTTTGEEGEWIRILSEQEENRLTCLAIEQKC